jgi:NADH:ubiquinone oxidoreductase subunit E
MRDVSAILQTRSAQPPNILATLQSIQKELGYVPREAVPKIAAVLGVTDSDVAGVLTFYHDLRTEPVGKHVIRFCMGESCLAMNCKKTLATLEKTLNCSFHETTKDGKFTLEKVYCLGNCALSPSILINEDLHGRCTPESLPGVLKDYQ